MAPAANAASATLQGTSGLPVSQRLRKAPLGDDTHVASQELPNPVTTPFAEQSSALDFIEQWFTTPGHIELSAHMVTPSSQTPLRIRADHPIRSIKALADAELRGLSPVFNQMAERGRPSIPREPLPVTGPGVSSASSRCPARQRRGRHPSCQGNVTTPGGATEGKRAARLEQRTSESREGGERPSRLRGTPFARVLPPAAPGARAPPAKHR